jgi:nitrate reductase gamma subunit
MDIITLSQDQSAWKIVSMAVAAVGFVCAGAARFLWVQRRCRHAVRALMTLALKLFAQLFLLYIQQNGIIGLIAKSTYISHKIYTNSLGLSVPPRGSCRGPSGLTTAKRPGET